MKYVAKYGIDGGVSPGFGVKYPDYCEKEENFELKDEIANEENALCKSAIIGYKISRNHLSNPDTDETKVTLLNLFKEKGEIINQKNFVSKYDGFRDKNGREINFQEENGKMVFSCSQLEHLFSLGK